MGVMDKFLNYMKLNEDDDDFYDDDYYYCEDCDMIDSDDNWFWYDDDEYTDYLHIKCNKDKYSEQ